MWGLNLIIYLKGAMAMFEKSNLSGWGFKSPLTRNMGLILLCKSFRKKVRTNLVGGKYITQKLKIKFNHLINTLEDWKIVVNH
jgi:hypothetical protein